MEYENFLNRGWPVNDIDKQIIERWKAAGREGSPSLRTINHIRYRLMFESDRFPDVQVATQEWFPEPPPRTGLPTLGRLHTEAGSRWFHALDGVPFDYREITAMGLMRLAIDRRWDEVEEFFEYCKQRRVTAIRPLLNLGSDLWTNKQRANWFTEGDTFWRALVPLAEKAAHYGLYTRYCLFGGVEPFVGHQLDWHRRPDVITKNTTAITLMHTYLEQAVGTLRDVPSVLFEIANEPKEIGFGRESNVILELGEHCADLAPDSMMNFGCANDEDSLWYLRSPATFLDEHLRRMPADDFHLSVKRIIESPQVDQNVMPFMSGEWMNLGKGGGTESTATAFATAAMLRLKHCIPSFHANCLLEPTIPDPATDACLQAWTQALDMIPITVDGAPTNGHWKDSPFHERRDEVFPQSDAAMPNHQGPLRIWGRVRRDGSYIGLSIREPAGYDLIPDDGRTIETLHLERWGDWQSRLLMA